MTLIINKLEIICNNCNQALDNLSSAILDGQNRQFNLSTVRKLNIASEKILNTINHFNKLSEDPGVYKEDFSNVDLLDLPISLENFVQHMGDANFLMVKEIPKYSLKELINKIEAVKRYVINMYNKAAKTFNDNYPGLWSQKPLKPEYWNHWWYTRLFNRLNPNYSFVTENYALRLKYSNQRWYTRFWNKCKVLAGYHINY